MRAEPTHLSMKLSMAMGIVASRLQNPLRDDPAGYEPSVLEQEVKLVCAVDEVNELQEESS
jgi:hypothetical protein